MKLLNMLLIGFFVTSSLYGQSIGAYVISSSGDDLMSADGGLYISVGEALNTELSEGDLMVSQGFLQVTVNGNAVSSSELLEERIIVYPNPANQYLIIQTVDNSNDYFYRLWNSEGQSISMEQLKPDRRVSLESLPDGIYFLSIHKDGLTSETIKVFKTN